MSKISNQSVYPAVTPVDGDYIIGTDVSDSNSTKTFLYSGIFSYINDKLTDPSITPVYASEKVVQEVRFSEAVSKGDPVYISGYNAGQNRPEVLKADASDSSQMPSFGLATADYDINTNGYIISAGDLTDVDTDVLGNEGDTVYVAPGGGLTITKPTGSNLIQNVGKISRSNQSNGSIEVFSVGRTNDVPNLSTGKIWVGSAANTIESTVVHLDETNNRLGIGTNSPSQKLDVRGDIRTTGGLLVENVSSTQFITATDTSANDVLKIEKVDDDVNLYLNDNNSSNNDSKIVFQSFRADNNTYIANFNNFDDGDESHTLDFNLDGESYFSVGYNDITGTPASQLRAIKCTKPIVANDGVYIGGSDAANKLDDYEEGTFTPTLVVSGTSTTINDKLGRYTKIGNLVHVEIFIRDFVPEDLTTIIQSCTNLPFTIKDTTFASFAIGQLRNFSNSNTGRGVVYGIDNTTTITFYDNGLYTTLPGDETTEVSVSITYQTS